MIADTCLLVDARRGDSGAETFLSTHGEHIVTTVITIGELSAGSDGLAAELERRIEILEVDREAAKVWGSLYTLLRSQGEMVGANDLWIASIALSKGEPVATRNVKDFGRIPGLTVVSY